MTLLDCHPTVTDCGCVKPSTKQLVKSFLVLLLLLILQAHGLSRPRGRVTGQLSPIDGSQEFRFFGRAASAVAGEGDAGEGEEADPLRGVEFPGQPGEEGLAAPAPPFDWWETWEPFLG